MLPEPSSSALTVEMLALSNSSCSSSSASLFGSGLSSSDSQTDDSRPHSPVEGHKELSPGDVETQVSTNLCQTPRTIAELTPRLNSFPRIPNLLDLDNRADMGYESEREGCQMSGISLIKRRKRSLGKIRPVARRRGFRAVHPSLANNSDVRESENSPHGQDSTIFCPRKPRIEPIVALDSPSPVFLSKPLGCSESDVQPQTKSRCQLPSQPRNSARVLLPSDLLFSAAPSGTRTRKPASGIGLGLPSALSSLDLERTSHIISNDTTSSPDKTVEGTNDPSICSSVSRASPQPSGSRPGEFGIPSGMRRFFRTYQPHKRRLYDIPEDISPKFSSKTIDFGRSSSRSSPWSASPATPAFSRPKRVYPPLLDACKKPLLWLSSRSPTTGRQTSPVIVHVHEQQVLASRDVSKTLF